MAEELGKAIKEVAALSPPNRDKQHSGIMALYELLFKAKSKGEASSAGWQTVTVDIDALSEGILTCINDRIAFHIEAMEANTKILDAIRAIKEQKLEPSDAARFELLEGLTIGWRDSNEDHFLDNSVSLVLATLVVSLLQESMQLEPFRKRVGLFIPAMDRLIEEMKKSSKNDKRNKKIKEEWLRLYAKPRDAVV